VSAGGADVTALTDRILEILRGCPYGLTAGEVADRLGVTSSNISSRLSKLAAYGIIRKTRGRIAQNSPPCAIYSAPTVAHSGIVGRFEQMATEQNKGSLVV
jgi:DNA-binding Lrp family transcriptional regulator